MALQHQHRLAIYPLKNTVQHLSVLPVPISGSHSSRLCFGRSQQSSKSCQGEHLLNSRLVCGSFSASVNLIQQPCAPAKEQPCEVQQQAQLTLLLSRCKTALACIAICATWSFLTSCFTGAATPFASMALAEPAPSTAGVQTAMKSAWTGLAAGFLHTLCGPDHLAALTPLTINRNRVVASALGALWGFGHSTGQAILGLVFFLLKDRFHDFLPALEKWSGLVVACTLIGIGVMGIYESHFEQADDAAGHTAEEQEAMKLALAGNGGNVSGVAQKSLATYVTGIVYGLQPDALFVVVPALALPTVSAAISYCSMFVFGTVIAMGGYTLLIGTTSAALTKERPWLQAHLSTIASAIAILVGALIGLAGLGFEVPFFS